MLDVRFIREHPEVVRGAARKKRIDVDVQQLLDVDVKRRELLAKIENLKALRNQTSKDIPRLQGDDRQKAIARMKEVAAESRELEGPLRDVETAFEALMLQMPNIPADDVPEGESDADNVELRTWGEIPEFDFELRDHVELGELLDIIDIPRATKLARSTRSVSCSNSPRLWGAFFSSATSSFRSLAATFGFTTSTAGGPPKRAMWVKSLTGS